MRWILLLCLVSPVLAHAAGYAEIRKCIHADGDVELRDRPCPPDSSTDRPETSTSGGSFSTIPESRPPSGLMERAEQSIRRNRKPAQRSRASAAHDERDLRCAEYQKREDEIDRRLRKGYKPGQGTKLRAERRRIRRFLGDACR